MLKILQKGTFKHGDKECFILDLNIMVLYNNDFSIKGCSYRMSLKMSANDFYIHGSTQVNAVLFFSLQKFCNAPVGWPSVLSIHSSKCAFVADAFVFPCAD